MTQANTILGLQAQTSIHAGTGQNTGIIDLPIQREGHNGWPCVFGSAVKGALRTRAEHQYGSDNDSVILVFGPDTNNASDHAGALAVSDARLLLFPMRSLTSHFKWVTCPAVIARYQRDCQRFGCPASKLESLIKTLTVVDEVALIPKTEATSTSSEALFLEEYRFKPQPHNLDALIEALAPLMVDSAIAKTALKQQLVIVSDDLFAHLVQHGTPVNAHIAIDSDTKIVKTGALWYQETLPPETLLYTGLSAAPSRNKYQSKSDEVTSDKQTDQTESPKPMCADKVLGAVLDLFAGRSWLQIGGNESVGMGWCAVSQLKSGG